MAAIVEPIWDLKERSVRLKNYKRLLRSQWYSSDRLQEMQAARLRELVVHAAETTPFYTSRFAETGIDPKQVGTIADLKDLPILTKSDVRNSQADLFSRDFERKNLIRAKTGGSTGVALEVFCDRRGVQKRAGAALRADRWSGWRLGQPIAAVWGNPPAVKTWRNKLRSALKDRIIYLDTMRIDAAAIDRFITEWKQLRPGLLYGHAHSLYILAEFLASKGTAIKPSGIVATSMMLLQTEREVIEKTFGLPVTNRYGCEEVSLIACECEVHHGMHINAEHVIVEFLKDDGTPCQPGEDGQLVVTELVNYGMPMIRYAVGDRGITTDRSCSCGRGLPLMESITGRTADFLIAEDGSRVAGISLIENTLTALPGIKQLQLIQEDHMRLDVHLVSTPDYDDTVECDLVSQLKQALGQDFEIVIHKVKRISQDSSGKYRFSICRIRE